ncbi:MAG TPA: DMT family transporter [Thermoplasmata archaeon]|nr:DMT family transporter [Thermoplasmata archaeon]
MRAGPYAAIALAVVSVSFSAIFISWSTSPFVTIALYRLALASLILAPIVLLDRRRPLVGIPPRDILLMMGVGAILATHFTLWIGSLKIEGVQVSVASSVILVTSHPLLVGILSHFVLRERLNGRMAVGIALGFSGVVVIAIADSTARSASLGGDLLAFLGGVAAGFYFLAGRRLRQRIPLLAYAFVVYVSATGFLFVFTLGLRESLTPIGPDWRTEMLLFLAMAVIPQIGGHTLYNWSLRWVPAPVVSLSLVGEPIGSSLLAWALLPGQVPGVAVGIGGALALAGIYLTVLGQGARTRETVAARDVE